MKPLPLPELQSAFKQYLLGGDNEAELSAQVVWNEGVSAETRLDVYRNAYYTRLQESLAHDFPVLLAVAGDRPFGRLVTAYLRDHPSTKPSLRWLGQQLPHWLRSAANEAALADLTALEWAVLHAFDAEDVPTLSPNDLATVPAERWPELRVRLHPSVSLLSVDCNVREVWSTLRRAGILPAALKRISEKLVVWRSSDSVQVEAIGSSCHSLVTRLAEHWSLSEACKVLAKLTVPKDVPTLVGECMHRALARGWISELALLGG